MQYPLGTRIRFTEEYHPYRVRASSPRWTILTKPFNLKRTVLYTVIDWQQYIRGTEDLIFTPGYETDQQCLEALNRFLSGESQVSHRNWINLSIKRFWPPRGQEVLIP